MRNLFLFITLFFADAIKAQMWCPPGATWYYNSGYGNMIHYTQISYTNDTAVNGKTYHVIKRMMHWEDQNGGLHTFLIARSYTYVENKIVYIGDSLNPVLPFDTLYNFGATIGDEWHLSPGFVEKCKATSVVVLDTGNIFINSVPLRFLKIQINLKGGITPPFGNLSPVTDTIVERIGSLNTYFFGRAMCMTAADLPPEANSLRCYSDSALGLVKHHPVMECDSTLYNDTGIKATKTHQPYNLFFNPDINLFQIKNLSVEELEVHLFDGLGRSARVIKVQEGICTLVGKDSAMGLYFYIVYCRGVVVGSGKLPVY